MPSTDGPQYPIRNVAYFYSKRLIQLLSHDLTHILFLFFIFLVQNNNNNNTTSNDNQLKTLAVVHFCFFYRSHIWSCEYL